VPGDNEKVGDGHWPSKGTKMLPRCMYFLNMKVLRYLGMKLREVAHVTLKKYVKVTGRRKSMCD
jgi:hypothetical protein